MSGNRTGRTAPVRTVARAQALALRITPHANTSRIITWMTEFGEPLTTLIKGADRPKSLFRGQFELFATVELLYYPRAGDGLSIARECTLLTARPAFRVNWRAFAAASYLAQLVMATSMQGERYPRGYGLIIAAFDALAAAKPRLEAVCWFELQWLAHLGFAPQLLACTSCRQPQTTDAGDLHWGGHGLICGACARGPIASLRTHGPLQRLRPDVLAILRRWQGQPDPRVLTATQCTARQLHELDATLGTVVAYHMESKLIGRSIAFDLMRSGVGSARRFT